VAQSAVTSTVAQDLAGAISATGLEAAAVPSAETPVEIVDHRPSIVESFSEAWRSRRICSQIVVTAFLQRFSRYRLGFFWLFFQTFMSLIGYTLIFGGGVFNVKAPNGMPYFLYMMVGMMGWQLFQSTTIFSSMSFIRLKRLVRDVHIPLVLLPIAGSGVALARTAVMLATYLIAVVYFWIHDGKLYAQVQPKYLFFSAAGLFLCAMFAWGISMWTAPMTAHTRDIRMVLRYVMPFWMLVTPVLYPIDKLHGTTRLVAELNPLSSPVEMTKVGMLGAGSVRLYAAIWSVTMITVVFASGIWFISRFGQRILRMEDQDEDEEMMM
jgi:ABC-type polysaccharide/polyol phosphate export permease